MKKAIFSLIGSFSLLFAGGFMQMGMVGENHIMLSSDKELSEGANSILVEIQKGGHGGDAVTDAEVKVKFFMPEMPGMPYMESKTICKPKDEGYLCNVNFGMGGTWQYQVFVKEANGTEYKYKSSINLGGASMGGMEHHNH